MFKDGSSVGFRDRESYCSHSCQAKGDLNPVAEVPAFRGGPLPKDSRSLDPAKDIGEKFNKNIVSMTSLGGGGGRIPYTKR